MTQGLFSCASQVATPWTWLCKWCEALRDSSREVDFPFHPPSTGPLARQSHVTTALDNGYRLFDTAQAYQPPSRKESETFFYRFLSPPFVSERLEYKENILRLQRQLFFLSGGATMKMRWVKLCRTCLARCLAEIIASVEEC